jgi:protein-tyrosine-phosphatase/predicted ATP-grasp superfamily ATP-dependent carboligase
MAGEKQDRALVLGHEMRSTLAVVRSLGRSGINVTLGTDRSQRALCKYSKYVRETVYFPPPGYGIGPFIDDFLKHLESRHYDLIIPTTDVFMIPLVKSREEIEKITLLAAPEDEAFHAAYDKFRTVEIASSLGIPIPATERLETASCSPQILQKLSLPVVMKPRYTQVVVNDTIHHYSVKIVRQEHEFRQTVSDYLCATGVLVQDFFAGTGTGVEVLCFDGRVLTAFQHERIHEPVCGGGSSYRKSVPLNPELLEYTSRLMKYLKWTGVAMVEFLKNEASGECVLVEINGRFWGSLPLAVHAGIDFPAHLYQMLVTGRRSFPAGYRTAIHFRNITNDLWWFYGNLKAPSNDPCLKTVPLRSVFKEIGKIIAGREGNDTLTRDDPRPGIMELGKFVQDLCGRFRGKLRTRFYRVFEKRGVFNWWAGRDKRIASLKSVERVLFICKGNICRSPFAAACLNKKAAIKSLSAGYYPNINRPAPRIAVSCAQSFGVDLSGHRSRIFNDAMLDEADAVFVMDMENYLEVLNTFPGVKHKLFFLTWLRKGKDCLSIPDPYGRTPEFFRNVYKEIADCIDTFSDFLASKSP